jgi:hypothetical protein
LTIIFFRGSTNESSGWKNTWIQRGDPNVCWPRDWLPKAVEKWGLRRGMLVLAVSYPPGPDYCREPVAKIAYELMEILLHSVRWHLKHPQMIVLVGYGIGGLVIKRFLAEVDNVAMQQTSTSGICKAFQENLQGIVFYGVPHSGSSEDFEKYKNICNNWDTPSFFSGGMSLQKFNQQMKQLDSDFRCSITGDTMIMAIVEGRPMGQEVQFHN